MEQQTIGIGRGPLVSRGSLADWEREFRARLAVTEEERELIRMREETANLHGELARSQAERAHLQGELTRSQAERVHLQGELTRSLGEIQELRRALRTAEKMLQGLRNSRGYRLFRLFGRWDSLEQNIYRTFR